MREPPHPELANEAQVYLLLCEGGLELEADLPLWADGWIARLPQGHNHEALWYLSTSEDRSPPNIWSALRTLGTHHDDKAVRRHFLIAALAFLNENTRPPRSVAHALSCARAAWGHPDGWPNFEADFDAMDHAPITETDIVANMRAWLGEQTRARQDAAGTP